MKKISFLPRVSITTLLMLFSGMGIFSCKKSAPKDFTQQVVTEEMSRYIAAFTSGVISKAASLRVQFAQAIVDDEQVGTTLEDAVFSLSPSVPGKLIWENVNTLLFKPDEAFTPGTAYQAKVELNKIFPNTSKELDEFEFSFKTKDPFFDVKITGLRSGDENETGRQTIVGTLFTADVAEDAAVEELLSAKQGGHSLPVEWTHSADDLEHSFVIKDVVRGDAESTVEINWNGSPIKAKVEGTKTIKIPQKGVFKLLNVFVNDGVEQNFVLNFSDPVLKDQVLSGLIRVEDDGNKRLRCVIDGNQIRVTPNRRFEGELRVDVEGVKSISGSKLEKTEWEVEFQPQNPQVRLVGKGVILPDADELIFPFEAVNLNAVEVEVFKIFNNNILQFLQTNELNGSNRNLKSVGRIIYQQKVPLSGLSPRANGTGWTRYALDLKKMISDDPQAIYQIHIGFRPEYVINSCLKTQEKNEPAVAKVKSKKTEYVSFMDSWYGINGYYEGYEWNHRKNPCFPAYYNSDRFISRNVFASNLGLVAKEGNDGGLFVAVTDIKTTEPLPGVDLEYYDYQQQLLLSTKSDGEGMAAVNVEGKVAFVIARRGDQVGYLKIADGKALSMSRFDVAGVVPQEGLKGYLYGDRGVWRPGDTLFLNFMLNDPGNKFPKKLPITFELYDPRGQLQMTKVTSENVNKIYPLTIPTAQRAITGDWRGKVIVGGATFEKRLKIETIKPNRLKMNLTVGEEALSSSEEPYFCKLQSNWLHGTPASNLKAKVEVQLKSVSTEFPKFKKFVFDDFTRNFSSEYRTIYDNSLNPDGFAGFTTNISNVSDAPGKMMASFKVRVFEKSGDFSTYNFTKPYFPYDKFVGIEIPENEYGSKRLLKDKDNTIKFVVVDKKGKPLPNEKINVGTYVINWRWWYDDENGNSRYQNDENEAAEVSATVVTDQNGIATWHFKPDEWNYYMVRACLVSGGHCASDRFYVGYPWRGDDENARKEAAMLVFKAEKEKYAIGETVKLNIPASDAGRVLVTIENGSRVLKAFWQKTTKGNNEVRFEATKDMSPNVYAYVTLVQPHGQVKNDLPIRMYGVVSVKVEDPNSHIQPVVKMPDELKPEGKFTLTVSEKNGKPMAYTVAIVDEGLLDLTGFRTPDPWEAFHAKEALGVRTWDIYDYVLGAYGGGLERLLSIGGGLAERIRKEKSQVNRFKPVVIHLGPFYLKKGEKGIHQITMPNYVGSVRTMVVAAGDNAYGKTEKTTKVKKALMVLPTLPRVLGPGEELKLPVNIFAMEKKVKNVSVSVKETNGLVRFVGNTSQNVMFTKTGDQMAYFTFKVADKVGATKFKITAKGGGEIATNEVEIMVRNPNPYDTKITKEILEAGKSTNLNYANIGVEGTNEAKLEISAIPPIDLGSRLDYLLHYPYGCIEQTLSGGFPQLYVDKLFELDARQQRSVPRHIKATIKRLKKFQTSSGGFTYWPGGDYYNQWANSYAGHFLLEAKALGYTVPEYMLNNWKRYQKNIARHWDPDQYRNHYYSRWSDELAQAYTLYSLALAGEPEMGAMNRLRELKDLDGRAKWRLAAAYALAGRKSVARTMVNELSTKVADYTETAYTFGSSLRDEAMILETLMLLDDKKKAADLVVDISEGLSSGRWYNTQAIAYSLMSIGKFVGGENVHDQFTFDYRLGSGKNIHAGSKKPIVSVNVPVASMDGKQISIHNTGAKTIFVRLIQSGQPVVGDRTAKSENLNLRVNYYRMDGTAINPAAIPQGTDFYAEVTVSHPWYYYTKPYKELALSQIFPSGWEIINTRMDQMEDFSNTSKPKYQDYRDDRVYTFFDLNGRGSKTFRIKLNAAYEGKYFLPSVSCEAMYDNKISARVPGQWVSVVSNTSGLN